MHAAQKELRKYASATRADVTKVFFKTGKGQYGEGDSFIGVSVPDSRRVAKKFVNIGFPELKAILTSSKHEDRLLALLILVQKFEIELKKSVNQPSATLKRIVSFYLSNRKQVNNWDLVDVSAAKILGQFCWQFDDSRPMKKLVVSNRHWDRRIAIVATYAFIRQNQLEITFQFSKRLLSDSEDLMHKATGWMLREAGKREKRSLESFVSQHGKQMPRTMLRYAIEKWQPEVRRKILLNTKIS